jgi:hypothetical protein
MKLRRSLGYTVEALLSAASFYHIAISTDPPA